MTLAIPLQSWAQCDFTVGSDVACSHSNLNSALLSAAFTSQAETICIAQNHTEPSGTIDFVNWDNPTPTTGPGPITLAGGYQLCSSSTPTYRTELDGNGSDPIISVTATAWRTSNVTLKGLTLENGFEGVHAEGPVTVNIENTRIQNNARGVSASADALVDIDSSSKIQDNGGVANGGGIACDNANITLAGWVWDNDSTNKGGGIYTTSDCDLTLNDGAYIAFNSSGSGGGLYFGSGTTVRGGGTGPMGVRISDNTASSRGGGMYATYSDILLGNVRIEFNGADDKGGGIYIADGGLVQIERFNWEQCVSPPRCTVLSNNYLTTGAIGTALYVEYDGEFRMYQGFIEGNHGPDNAGWLMAADEGQIILDGVQIWDNRTEHLFSAFEGGSVTAGFVTAGGNSYQLSDIAWDVPTGAYSGNESSVSIYSSILADHKAFESTGGTISVHCLMADILDGLTTTPELSVGGVDPLFIDPASGNLRVETSSPANDYCNTSAYTPLDSDYDVEWRGYDIVGLPDQYGPYDLGADETHSGITISEVFSDGFENGTSDQWSSTVE